MLRPRALTRTAPGGDAIHVLDDPLDRGLHVGIRRSRRERLDLLQERDEVVRVTQQDLVKLAQRGGRRVEEGLTAIDGTEPVSREKLRNLGLNFFLLRVEA